MAVPSIRDEPNTLGQRVRRLRLANGLTQGQLAARMRVTQVRVSQIEAGGDTRPLRLRTLCDLADGLGVDLATLIAGDQRYEHIDITDAAALPQNQTTLRAVSPLIDRTEELAQIVASLRGEGTRLLTLVGPAGVGKTQLALHATALLQADHPDQSLVSLATCRDAASLVTAIARAIGLRERDSRPLRERLLAALHERRLLLLLDNVEQVLPAAATLVADLVTACPRLTLLVTSRAPLNIQLEQIFTVHPLRLPDARDPVTLAAAASAPAVQMFVQRVAVALPGFAVTEANAAKVTAICRRLDGLPLAIELAAPRMRVMSLDQLLRQIDHRFTLLTAGARDLPVRQQSLQANISWSVELLTPDQQALFRRLAVFADGFTLQAAVTVMTQGGDLPSTTLAWSASDVADGIALLLEQNLLMRQEQADAEPRFAMLETIHAYAREQLMTAGEEPLLRERHLRWISDLAEQANAALCSFEQDPWLRRLDAEWENARAALRWAIGREDTLGALRAGAALADYWYLRGMLSEGAAFLEQALALRPDAAGADVARARVRALAAASQIAQPRGDLAGASAFAEEGLSLARTIDDRLGEAQALALLGNHAITQGELETAATLHRAALRLFQGLGGNQRWVVAGLNNLSQIAYQQGSHQEALELGDDALTAAMRAGDAWGLALSHQRLGDAALALGQLSRAADHVAASLIQNRSQGSDWGIANAVAACASLATAAGMPQPGIRLFAAAASLYQATGVRVPPKLRPDWPMMLDRARTQLSEAQSADAWAHGSRLSPSDAIAEAHLVAARVAQQEAVPADSPALARRAQRPRKNSRVRTRRFRRSARR